MGVGPHASGRGWGPARNKEMQAGRRTVSSLISLLYQLRSYRAIVTLMATTSVWLFSPDFAVTSIR